MSWADNCVRNWQNLPISSPKADLYNINAHIKFGENPLRFTQVIVQKWKCGRVAGRKFYQKLMTFAQEQSQTRSLHYQCTYQILWKSIDYPEMKMQTYDGQIILSKIDKIYPKPALHNINAHTEFGENPLTFTQVNILKRTDVWQTDGQKEGHMDSQCDTIILSHYSVVGYNKMIQHTDNVISLDILTW